jgi:phospholipid/cholesterol/gamma-HCH transport system ATP-binding protein
MSDNLTARTASALLEFRGVSIKPTSHQMTGLEDVSMVLMPGEVVLVQVQEGLERTPLADAAEGLLSPDQGSVLFQGVSWGEMTLPWQAKNRGRIRRVFEHYGWISNLDVLENICLAECHHTDRPLEEIRTEAERVAKSFGLEGIPDGRPSRVHPMTLRKLEWVRAFMGTPALIILERPLFGAPKVDAVRLFEAVCAAARGGAGVLWTTDEERVWGCSALENARRYRLHGERLVPVQRGEE